MVGVRVQGPVAAPYRYGLQSVAQVVDVADPHEFYEGVTWEADCPVGPLTGLVNTICDPNTGKALVEPNIDQDGVPFRGYGGLFCKLPGRDNLLQRADAVFSFAEWPFIEHQAWTGEDGGSPLLANTAVGATTDLTPTPGTAVSIEEGGGLLGQWLAHDLGQEGVVWSPRQLAYWWAAKGLATPVGPTMRDPLGNAIVFAAGGSYPGPVDPDPATGTEMWLYATGPVQVRRMTKIQPTLESAFDRTENEVFGIVERSYLVLWGCGQAAVLVDPLLPPQA